MRHKIILTTPIVIIAIFIQAVVNFGVSAHADESYKNWGLGFVEIDNQFPLALNHNSFRPLSPQPVGKNNFKLTSGFALTNTFILEEDHYFIDVESRVLNLGMAYGTTDSFEVSARVPLVWRGGGYMDSFIDDFHKMFGFSRGQRPSKPEDTYEISGNNKDGSTFEVNDTGLELGDLVLGIKHLITPGDETLPAWSILAELRLPTASNISYGQSSNDLTLGLVASKKVGKFFLYWGGAYIFYGDTEIDNIVLERHHFEGFGGAEYPVNKRLSLNLAFYGASAFAESIQEISNYTTYFDTGLKYNLNSDTILGLAMRQNPAPSDATADVSFVLGLEYFIRN